ncbi:MAG: DUF1499 domain-containing protein [Thiotrichales bacterium]|nr:DUF1499 domain-containing protein [Thiotrichales bacterium]
MLPRAPANDKGWPSDPKPALAPKRAILDDMPETLRPCSSFPNCVCSRSDASPRHHIAPFALPEDPAVVFARLKTLLAAWPRTTIVTATEDYIHATCRTRIGFVDDLECHLCVAEGVIHVRSASRFGFMDKGVNRARVEVLRRQLSNGSTGDPPSP